MPAALRGERKLLSDSDNLFSASTKQVKTYGFPDSLVKRLWGRLHGTFLPNTVTVPGTVHGDGALKILPLITIKKDGKIIKQGTAASFARASEYYDQADGALSDIYSGAAISQPFDIIFPICFEAPGSIQPLDTVLDGRLSHKLTIEVTWGAVTDLVTGNTSTPAFSGTPQLDWYIEHTEAFDITEPLWELRETEQPFTSITTATAADFDLTYEPGNVIGALQIRQEDSGDLTDGLINGMSLLINGNKEVPLQDLTRQFEEGYSRFNFGITRTRKGYIHLELSERDNGSSRPLTTGLGALGHGEKINSLGLRMNTTAPVGTGSITVHKFEFVPKKNQAA